MFGPSSSVLHAIPLSSVTQLRSSPLIPLTLCDLHTGLSLPTSSHFSTTKQILLLTSSPINSITAALLLLSVNSL